MRTSDIVILGGGMVGLSIAHQLLEKGNTKKITIIDKEATLGMHSSGRNSGVLHAGIYYKPKTIKARVCVDGAQRLKQWISERNLPINNCGKIVVPTKENQDKQLEVLMKRGQQNGADVEIWNDEKLKKEYPYVRSASGRCLWSPNTSVVQPKLVVERLSSELEDKGVEIWKNQTNYKIDAKCKKIETTEGIQISYGYLFNCAGLNADRVADQCGINHNYKILPFKGLYWKVKVKSKIIPTTNIYPVPDLNVPFLGVHFTPSADINPTISIGPTAIPALGRENYKTFEGFDKDSIVNHLTILSRQYLNNTGNIRRYAREQAFLFFRPLLVKSAQQLIPELKSRDIVISNKVAIRSQLFNQIEDKLEEDFQCITNNDSTHVLNAISPAFTASFALADLIIKKSGIVNS